MLALAGLVVLAVAVPLRIGGEAAGLAHVTTADLVSVLLVVVALAPLSTAARQMAENGINHLVAVQPGTDRPVGVLSRSNLLRCYHDWIVANGKVVANA